MRKKLLCSLLVFIMLLSTGTVSVFATNEAVSYDAIDCLKISPSKENLTNSIISKADSFIFLDDDNVFKISDFKKLSKNLTENEIRLVKLQLKETNTSIKKFLSSTHNYSYEIRYSHDSLNIYPSLSNYSGNQTVYASIASSKSKKTSKKKKTKKKTSKKKKTKKKTSKKKKTKKKTKNGVTKMVWKWFGVRLYLSKSMVGHILNGNIAAGAVVIGHAFPGLGPAIALAVSTFILTDFLTSRVARPIYVDVGLKFPFSKLGPIGIRGYGFQ